MAPLNVAVIGAGPAGIYASDILSKSGLEVNIDLFERLPAPYGLVRYGVAPDHPRIKQIIVALYKILQRGDIRLLGNVEVGRDVTIDDLRDHYDAIIIATGADRDHPLDIPGVDLPESYGAADFVSWYDGNPDYPRTWPLKAREVAVLGVGNVALDVSRVLAQDRGPRQRRRGPGRKPDHRRACVRPPRPRAGQVHAAGAARAGQGAGRRRHCFGRGLRLR